MHKTGEIGWMNVAHMFQKGQRWAEALEAHDKVISINSANQHGTLIVLQTYFCKSIYY
jgi:hypothetical protein